VLPQPCLDHVVKFLPGSRSPLAEPHAWHVLIEAVAERGAADGLRSQCEATLAGAFELGLIEDAVIAANETQAEAFWSLRESIAPSERARGFAVQHDISVPVELMPAFVDAAVPIIERDWPGTEAVAFGHLGDGNVHFHVIAPGDIPRSGITRQSWEANQGKAISRQVHDLVTQWGGSISAEHGIGQFKADELERLADPVALAIMRSVKQALDPGELLNPGKLLVNHGKLLAPQGSSA
jgi:FAD/FMN-containing dehydrogenase